MSHRHESGAINVLLLPLLAAILLLVAALVLAGWAYSGRQDYKDNVDAKVAGAVKLAKDAESKAKEAEFADRVKNPLKAYTGPSEFGSIALKYPKTWSGYVVSNTASGNATLEGYFSPNVVPAITDQSSIFALRVSVVDSAYSDVLQGLQSKQGVTVTPYALPKVPKTVGVRIEGQIEDQKSGTMIILPLRDKTLEVYTESNNYETDFNNNILPNLSFIP